MKTTTIGCLFLLATACSSSTSSPGSGATGTATVSGSIGGASVQGTAALAQSGLQNGNGVYAVGVTVYPNATSCPGPTGSSRNLLGIYVENDPPSGQGMMAAPPTPGEYNVPTWGNGLAGGTFEGPGGTTSIATSGTVTLTTVTSTLVEGHFSLVFDSSGTVVQGAFSAPVCPNM